MNVKIVYNDLKDREYLNLIDSKFPIFIEYIDSIKNKNEAFKIKNHWAARKDPFIEVSDDEKVLKVFYSETKGDNAILQFLNYINNDCKSN